MTLRDQVFAHAALLAGEMEERQSELLSALCTAVTVSLSARLKEGLTPDDCKVDFIAAASLLALASLNGINEMDQIGEFKAGDLTVVKRSGSDAASNCLRNQAELMIAPYLKDRFSFTGV